MLGIVSIVLARPFDHVGIFCRLPIDGPRSAVVMGRRHARLIIDVCEDLEAELGILVKHLQSARSVVAAILAYEISVAEQAFEILTYLFAARRAGIARKGGTAISDELV